MAFDLYFNHRRTFLTKTDWTTTFSFEVQPRKIEIRFQIKWKPEKEETKSRRKKSRRKTDLWPWEIKTNEFIKDHDGTRKAFRIEIFDFLDLKQKILRKFCVYPFSKMKGPEINKPDQINEPVRIVTMVRGFGPNFISGGTSSELVRPIVRDVPVFIRTVGP